MIFRERSLQTEHFDNPERTAEEVADGYRWLARMNRLLLSADPFQRELVRMLGRERCRQLSILDLGAGDGWMERQITPWAARRGWTWTVTNLELNPRAFPAGPDARHVVGSALAVPFADGAFDVVIASFMTHHLADAEQVTIHFREAWRVARRAVIIADAHRNRAAHEVMRLLLLAAGCPRHFREDGLLSIRRGWLVPEWKEFARAAGIPDAQIRLYFGSKLILTALKPDAADVPAPVQQQL